MKTMKIGHLKCLAFNQQQIDKMPFNINKMNRIYAPNTLTQNKNYNKYINENTMGALNNWADHENINIYFKPLQQDLFNDLAVHTYKDTKKASFVINLPKEEKRSNIADFLKELYTKVADASKNMQ